MTGPAGSNIDAAERLLSERRFEAAFEKAMLSIQVGEAPVRAVLVLALIALESGNPRAALDLVDKVPPAMPDGHVLAVRARALLAVNAVAEARDTALLASASRDLSADSANMAGVVLSRTGLLHDALPLFRMAVDANPTRAGYLYNFAVAQQFMGAFDEARSGFWAAIERDPHHVSAMLALSALPAPPERLAIKVEAVLADPSISHAERLTAAHALARLMERAGRWEESITLLDRYKAPVRAETGFDEDAAGRMFEAARSRPVSIGDSEACTSEAPIFVVGMPRTGTSLVERILSSHHDIVSVGELAEFGLLLKRKLGTPGPLVLDHQLLVAACAQSLDGLGNEYLEAVAPLAGGSSRFVDKMPFNFFYCRLIRRVLPNARLVIVRRDPIDAALSNYRQLFARDFPYYHYAYGLEATAGMIRQFESLADALVASEPADRVLAVRYEDVVLDLEGSARKLIGFCGLEWDPSCLAFNTNPSPATTASSIQVRSPVHDRSVGQRHRYPQHAARIASVLEQAG